MLEYTINCNEAGQRFDKFLVKYLPLAPKSFFYKMLRKKNITLNGKKASGSEKLSTGDKICFFLSEETLSKFHGQTYIKSESKALKKCTDKSHTKLDILYEDSHTIFINKPAGMLSQKAGPDDISVIEYLIRYLLDSGQISEEELSTFRPSVCNRLDRNTSGIITAGKSLAALQDLSTLFRERTLCKYYLCLVSGIVQKSAHIKGYLSKDACANKVRFSEREFPGSSFIETEYRPLTSGNGVTLTEVHLITGKPHQIRAHMASQGHPIIGDYKYGNRKINNSFRNKYGLKYQLLHAVRICMPECKGSLAQISGKTICAPLPELFRQICEEKNIGKDYLKWPHGVPEDSGVQPWKNL